MNLNELKDQAYKIACDHGFHDNELSNEHWLCLVISELMEAVEADRKNKRACTDSFKELLKNQEMSEEGLSERWYSMWFATWYDNDIKGSIEEELADAVIRLLDLYGLRSIDLNEDAFDNETIEDYSKSYKNKSFTESIYYITGEITSRHHHVTKSAVLPEMLILELFGLAKHLGIDLLWHIEQKTKYNQLRERMHGKKY